MRDARRWLSELDDIEAPDLWPIITDRAAASPVLAPGSRAIGQRLLAPMPFAALASAAALAIAAVLVLGPLGGGETAQAILAAASQTFGTIPPFRADTVDRIDADVLAAEYPGYAGGDAVIRRRVTYAGPDRWRRDTLDESDPALIDGGSGSFWVWDGSRLGIYNAASNLYAEHPVAAGYSPLGELSWESIGARSECDDGASVVADEVVAGRLTRHIDCGELAVWVDAATGLIMRHVTDQFMAEVTAVDYAPEIAEDAFVVAPPPGADTDGADEPTTDLVVGEPAPTWQGDLLDGGRLQLDQLRGDRVAVYVWADWCDAACLDDLPAVEALASGGPVGLRVLTVAIHSSGELVMQALLREGVTFPVVVDDGSVVEAWGLGPVPVLVILDAGGVVERVAIGPEAGEELDALARER